MSADFGVVVVVIAVLGVLVELGLDYFGFSNLTVEPLNYFNGCTVRFAIGVESVD